MGLTNAERQERHRQKTQVRVNELESMLIALVEACERGRSGWLTDAGRIADSTIPTV